MNKKEKFHLAKALAQSMYRARKSVEAQVTVGSLVNVVALELELANGRNPRQEFMDLYQTIVGLTIQHGDLPGELTSVEVGGISYP